MLENVPADDEVERALAGEALSVMPDARPKVLVVGPGEGSRGGVAAVIDTLLASGLAARFRLARIATYGDGERGDKARAFARGFVRAARLLAGGGIELVYVHTASRWSFRRKAAIVALARLFRTPYVLHVHGAEFHLFYERTWRPERAAVRWALRGSAGVIALAPTWERRLLEIAPCRVFVVPNPVPTPDEPAAPAGAEERIVSLGRLGDRKGSVTLVRALGALALRHPRARLVLAGNGDVERVAAEADRLGVAELVELPGWIGPAERSRLLRSATVFALPSRNEGVPVALLEAMSYGLPVVVSPVGGIPDVVRDGEHGYFVPPDDPAALADAIARLLDDPESALRMGRAARRDVESHYAVEVVAARIGDALAECLAGRVAGA